jgi:hypothetical protein
VKPSQEFTVREARSIFMQVNLDDDLCVHAIPRSKAGGIPRNRMLALSPTTAKRDWAALRLRFPYASPVLAETNSRALSSAHARPAPGTCPAYLSSPATPPRPRYVQEDEENNADELVYGEHQRGYEPNAAPPARRGPTCRIVGKSQPVVVLIGPISFTTPAQLSRLTQPVLPASSGCLAQMSSRSACAGSLWSSTRRTRSTAWRAASCRSWTSFCRSR